MWPQDDEDLDTARQALWKDLFDWCPPGTSFDTPFRLVPKKTKEDIQAWLSTSKTAIVCMLQYAGFEARALDAKDVSLEQTLKLLVDRKLQSPVATTSQMPPPPTH